MNYYNPIDTFQKGAEEPLEYPNRRTDVKGVVSLRIGKQHGVRPPTSPGDPGYKAMVDEFLEVRDHVERDSWPHEFLQKHYPSFFPFATSTSEVPEPIRDANINEINPKAAALLVRMDLPSDLGNYIFDYLVRQGVPFRYSEGMDFARGRVLFNKMLWDELYPASEKFFEVKYFYGSARPEEFLGIPGCVLTSYEQGCPKHPRYIAGHGTLAGVTQRVIERFFSFSGHEMERSVSAVSCYQFAQYREFSGVHFTEDNIEGLRFGYKLPFANN